MRGSHVYQLGHDGQLAIIRAGDDDGIEFGLLVALPVGIYSAIRQDTGAG
ncbi:MAG: hypothetical protein OXP69_05020 [Spirochaetaceae bacterium]|nr:hypothetical protein [Spirochaetaceae bacterium]